MKPLLRGAIVLAVLAVLGMALWVVLGQRPGAPGPANDGDRIDGVQGDGGAMGPGGIVASDSDLLASGTVQGRVVDIDGAPLGEGTLVLSCLVDDEVVLLSDGVIAIGQDGAFEGPGCRGRICAELRHPYMRPTEPWVLRPGARTTLTAEPLPRLWGRVVDASGKPVAAAKVRFTSPTDGEADPTAMLPVVTSSTTTDAEGTFSVATIEAPDCGPCEEARHGCERPELPLHDRMSITAHGRGGAPTTITIDAGLGRDPDAPVVLTLAVAADPLTGRVTDAAGEPYPRAYALAQSNERPREQHRADVVDGDFEFEDLVEGSYAVRVIADGIELARVDAARPGDDLVLRGDRPALGPALRVVVEDAEGRPVADAEVSGGPFRTDTTDERGQLGSVNVIPGRYRLRVRAPGRRPFDHAIEIAATDEVRTERTERIRLPPTGAG